MKQRRLVCNGDTVRAIMADTQTTLCRIVNPKCKDYPILRFVPWTVDGEIQSEAGRPLWVSTEADGTERQWGCPFGVAGDRLYITEAMTQHGDGAWYYDADGVIVRCIEDHEDAMLSWLIHTDKEKCAANHAPSWSARTILRVIRVGVQRLSTISELDCERELGVKAHSLGDNPWVWRVKFKKLDRPTR